MSGFLARLALRAMQATPSIRPRLSTRFETARGHDDVPFPDAEYQGPRLATDGNGSHSLPPEDQPRVPPPTQSRDDFPLRSAHPGSSPHASYPPRTLEPNPIDGPPPAFQAPLNPSANTAGKSREVRASAEPGMPSSNPESAWGSHSKSESEPVPPRLEAVAPAGNRSNPEVGDIVTNPTGNHPGSAGFHHQPPAVFPHLDAASDRVDAKVPFTSTPTPDSQSASRRPAESAPGRGKFRLPETEPVPPAPNPVESPVAARSRIQPPAIKTYLEPRSHDPSWMPPAPSKPRENPPPDVHINIGRVEIRAAMPQAGRTPKSPPTPRLSLDAILKKSAPAP